MTMVLNINRFDNIVSGFVVPNTINLIISADMRSNIADIVDIDVIGTRNHWL